MDAGARRVHHEPCEAVGGGGYPETGLSDTALLWRAREARAAGLVFDVSLLSHYVASGSDPIRHDPLTLGFRLYNAALTAGHALGFGRAAAERLIAGRRRLTNPRAVSIAVASSAINHVQSGEYEPVNVEDYRAATDGFSGVSEPVTALPEAGVDLDPLGEVDAA